jgi:HEAT repeat protein
MYMLDPRTIQALIENLSNPDYNVRRQAIISLGESGDLRAVEPIIKCLSFINTDWYTFETAAFALGKLKDPRAITPLLSVLRSSERQGGTAVAYALGQMGTPAPGPSS